MNIPIHNTRVFVRFKGIFMSLLKSFLNCPESFGAVKQVYSSGKARQVTGLAIDRVTGYSVLYFLVVLSFSVQRVSQTVHGRFLINPYIFTINDLIQNSVNYAGWTSIIKYEKYQSRTITNKCALEVIQSSAFRRLKITYKSWLGGSLHLFVKREADVAITIKHLISAAYTKAMMWWKELGRCILAETPRDKCK